MQITVKSTRVLKTGTNKSGDWELIGLTSDDGTTYTTFFKSASSLAPGTVIDIGEPEIKEGKVSFKDFTVVSAPPVFAPADKSEGMTPEKWAEKDRAEQWSRECNTCFMGIMNLASSHYEEVQELPLFKAACLWGLAHFQPAKPETQQKPSPEPAKSKSEGITTDLSSLVFTDAGKLKTYLKADLKMTGIEIAAATAGYNLLTEDGRRDCWADILKTREQESQMTETNLEG